MADSRASMLKRRLVSIPALILGVILVTALLPVLLLVAIVVDIARWLGNRTPWMAIRLVAFIWIYTVCGLFGVTAMAISWVITGFGRSRTALLDHAYWVQSVWVRAILGSAIRLVRLDVESEGTDQIPPGPILVFSRHASLVDTLLPALTIVHPHGIRLRYVLKKELLSDPVLDVGGNRLPNHFVDRNATDPRAELRSISQLASTMTETDGVLIFPEGTRFTPERRERILSGLQDEKIREYANSLQYTLPPQPGGSATLMAAAPDTDVIIFAHHGLEPLARLGDAWKGEIVGSTVSIKVWRHAADTLPTNRAARSEWLNERWSEVDAWVASKR